MRATLRTHAKVAYAARDGSQISDWPLRFAATGRSRPITEWQENRNGQSPSLLYLLVLWVCNS